MTTPVPISVCIVCRNEAEKLVDCLRSVRWADEVLVLDLQSSDGSADVARSEGATVVHHDAVPVVERVRNVIAGRARNDWILALDPDERVTPGLAEELASLARRGDLDAVVLPRTNCDFGFRPTDPSQRFERQLRLYRRSALEWPTEPNALPDTTGKRVHDVPPSDDLALLHLRNRNVEEILDRIVRYAPAQARWMIEDGQRFTARGMITAIGDSAVRQFLIARPWRDGVPGLFRASVLVAFKMYVWLAFWQLSGWPKTPDDDRTVQRLGLKLEGPRLAARILRLPAWLATRLRR